MNRIHPLLLSLLLAPPAFSAALEQPESVEHDARTGIIYVSNKEATPGNVVAIAPDGSIKPFAVLQGEGKPHGLRIAGEVLYVVHGASVQGFSLADGKAQPVIDIDGAQFLNGLASDGRSRLWASDSLTRRVHGIDLSTDPVTVATVVADTVFPPNGVEFDAKANRLLIVGWGEGAKIAQHRFSDGQFSDLVTTELADLDGAALDCHGNFYTTAWSAGTLVRFDAPLFERAPVTLLSGLQKPSDIRFVPSTGEVLVPNYDDSSLSRHQTDCAGGG